MAYFYGCSTLSELKAEFRRLAKIHHPDLGGDTETMQAINAEFDQLFPLFRAACPAGAPESKETAESVRREFYTANGWKGSRYDPSLPLKEVSARIRAHVKATFPAYRFSVRVKSASMCDKIVVEMLEAPAEIYKTLEQLTAEDRDSIIKRAVRCNDWPFDSWTDADADAEILRLWDADRFGCRYKVISAEIQAVADEVDAFVCSYNRSDSDGMIDYFDEHFYYFGCLGNGSGVKFVPRPDKYRRPLPGGTTTAPAQPDPVTTPTAPAVRVVFTPHLGGVEAYFCSRPSAAVRDALKADGWRWHRQKQCWYNKNSVDHLQRLRQLTETPALSA